MQWLRRTGYAQHRTAWWYCTLSRRQRWASNERQGGRTGCRSGRDGTFEETGFSALRSSLAVYYLCILFDPDISLTQRRLILRHVFLVKNRIVRDLHIIVELGVEI